MLLGENNYCIVRFQPDTRYGVVILIRVYYADTKVCDYTVLHSKFVKVKY